MTDRERWTIYPLLFLTLGIAVKDRIIDTVQCGTLVVRDRQGHQQVIIEATPQGGLIRADAGNSQIGLLLGHTDRLAGLMFVDEKGKLHSPSLVIQTSSASDGKQREGRGKDRESQPGQGGHEAAAPDATGEPQPEHTPAAGEASQDDNSDLPARPDPS
ncbi:MAG TPA: hypothetical protein VL175_19845 [Pirellulales bacterium]|jgi:hypothetical protein|nr:hypothetical protein [Pirellulales bacterium]